MDDLRLLNEYVEAGSEQAFAELVRRHMGIVYSAALRQMREPNQAEDVAQAVFFTLARNAGNVPRNTVLSAWLLTTTRYVAAHAKRSEMRRKSHEHKAAEMADRMSQTPSPQNAWEQIAPDLDEAIAELRQKNRDALVLRYFEGLSVHEVADRLGITEDAVRQRVSRALDHLRAFFNKRGLVLSATTLGMLLSANAASAAPAGLAAVAAAAAAKCSACLAMTKGVLSIMVWTKAKVAATSLLALLLAGGTAAIMVHQTRQRNPDRVAIPNQRAAPGIRSPLDPLTRSRFEEVYRLAEGQVLKRVTPPFITEREAILRNAALDGVVDMTISTITVFTFDGQVRWHSWSGHPPMVSEVLRHALHMPSYAVQMDDLDRTRLVPGDWILRENATVDEKMAAFGNILREEVGWRIRFEKRQLEQEVIVATGRYDPPGKAGFAHFYIDTQEPARGWSCGDMSRFLIALGELINIEVIDKTETGKEFMQWQNHIGPDVAAVSGESVDPLLQNMARQTGLQFAREIRPRTLWVAIPTPQ